MGTDQGPPGAGPGRVASPRAPESEPRQLAERRRLVRFAPRWALLFDANPSTVWILPTLLVATYQTYRCLSLGWFNVSIGVIRLRGGRTFR